MNRKLFEESQELYNAIGSVKGLIEEFEKSEQITFYSNGLRPINSKVAKDLVQKLKELKEEYEKEFEELK